MLVVVALQKVIQLGVFFGFPKGCFHKTIRIYSAVGKFPEQHRDHGQNRHRVSDTRRLCLLCVSPIRSDGNI